MPIPPRCASEARALRSRGCYYDPMIRDDYFERMIKELGSTIARAMGLESEGKHAAAIQEIDSCYRALGMDRSMVGRLDSNTLASMLGAAKSEALADVLDADATLLMNEGREAAADSRKREALALRQVAAR